MPRNARFLAAAFSLLLLAAAAGCAAHTPRIADVQNNPGRFEDRSVIVEGTVTSSWNVPLVPFKMYKVDDGTGEITVVSQNSRTPGKGARVRVRGRVEDVATIGGRALGVHLREQDLSFKGY